MINYFKELLETLKKIEVHLGELAKCVRDNRSRHGANYYLNTGHWND